MMVLTTVTSAATPTTTLQVLTSVAITSATASSCMTQVAKSYSTLKVLLGATVMTVQAAAATAATDFFLCAHHRFLLTLLTSPTMASAMTAAAIATLRMILVVASLTTALAPTSVIPPSAMMPAALTPASLCMVQVVTDPIVAPKPTQHATRMKALAVTLMMRVMTATLFTILMVITSTTTATAATSITTPAPATHPVPTIVMPTRAAATMFIPTNMCKLQTSSSMPRCRHQPMTIHSSLTQDVPMQQDPLSPYSHSKYNSLYLYLVFVLV